MEKRLDAIEKRIDVLTRAAINQGLQVEQVIGAVAVLARDGDHTEMVH